MVRSHWLRVCAMRLFSALVTLAFTPAPRLPSLGLAAPRNSQAYSTKDTPPPSGGCGILPVSRFQVLFHSPSGVLFTFPSRYSCAIGSLGYSALDRGRPGFGQGSSCPALLRYRIMEARSFRLRGCHPLWPCCPAGSAISALSSDSTGHPHAALQPRRKAVWAPPLSLAATHGISLDFFSAIT